MIVLDAMGGDHAPAAAVEGGVLAAREYGIPITLVGDETAINAELAKLDTAGLDIIVHHAPESVGMDESPTVALRKKKKSSISIGMDLVREGKASAFVSAGNTGAVMAVATFTLRTIEGILRPAISVLLPTWTGNTVLLDAGANVDCRSMHLFQFGLMGSVYAQLILDREAPKVGLLNIGEEESKGTDVIRVAASLFRKSKLNFIGNVEGKEVYRGNADVIVCDGFTGNVALKISESAAEMFVRHLKKIFGSSILGKIAYLLVRPGLKEFRKTIDYSEYGGAPLLGVKGVVIIAHGSSSAKAVKNAVGQAHKAIQRNVVGEIAARMGQNREVLDSDHKGDAPLNGA